MCGLCLGDMGHDGRDFSRKQTSKHVNWEMFMPHRKLCFCEAFMRSRGSMEYDTVLHSVAEEVSWTLEV